MLDATKSEEQRRLLEIELDAVGIRLNKKKPDVVFKKRTTGGASRYYVYLISLDRLYPVQITLTATVKLTKTDEKTIRSILASCTSLSSLADWCLFTMYIDKLHNCDVMIREDVSQPIRGRSPYIDPTRSQRTNLLMC